MAQGAVTATTRVGAVTAAVQTLKLLRSVAANGVGLDCAARAGNQRNVAFTA
jgi:hypothetical protein